MTWEVCTPADGRVPPGGYTRADTWTAEMPGAAGFDSEEDARAWIDEMQPATKDWYATREVGQRSVASIVPPLPEEDS